MSVSTAEPRPSGAVGRRRVLTRVRVVTGAWGAVCAALFALVSLRRWAQLTPTSWDNAIFEQAVRSYSRLDPPIVDIKGPGFNILGDHFSPITALLAPVYALWPDGRTLLLAQAVLLGVSVAVVGSLAVRTVGWRAGGALALCYGLSFGLASAVASDFHEVAFAAPLLALAGAAYVERRGLAVVAWSLPLLLVKEDLGATVVVIGLLLWWTGDRRRGVGLAVAGAVGAALVLLVIIPSFNPAGGYDYASSVGGDRGTWETLWTDPGTKVATVLLTLAAAGFAALLSPWVLVALPTFAWRFVGDNPYYWGTDWHYSLVLMPIVFVAAVDAMRRRPWTRWGSVVALGVTATTLVGSPLAALAQSETWQPSPRAAAAREVADAIPDGASVETDIGLITHLAGEHRVYWLGTVGDASPQYVLLDHLSNVGSPPDALVYARSKHGGTWQPVLDVAGYQLVRRAG